MFYLNDVLNSNRSRAAVKCVRLSEHVVTPTPHPPFGPHQVRRNLTLCMMVALLVDRRVPCILLGRMIAILVAGNVCILLGCMIVLLVGVHDMVIVVHEVMVDLPSYEFER